MPSWKKVIISGSNAALNSLTVTNGATISGSITLTGSISQVDYIDFNTGSATPAWKSGRIFWDNTEGALSVYNSEADVTLQVGQENWTRVFNDTGATIPNGTPVRIIGTHGDHPEVVLAQSIQVSGSSNLVNQVLGLATHTIEDQTFGYVTTQGLVRGLDTSAFIDGDTLYVSSSAGELTSTVLDAPYEIIPIGQVVKASPGGSGIIYVAVQQPLDFTDLSSVYLGGGTYTDGDLWTYSGPNKRWEHKKQLSGSYGLTGSLSINGTLLVTGSATIGATTAGASENTLTLGARDAGSEGGQLGLNAPGGTYTSASMIDNYNNSFRILKGTNATSTGLVAQWNLHNTQMQLPGYTSPTSMPGTVSGLLAFDTSGNIITTTTGSGGGGGVTINNNTDNYIVTATGTTNTLNGESGLQYNGTSLTVTGQITASGAITSNANGAMYFRGGDDAEFWDINVANTVGIYGQQTQAVAGLKLGSGGATLFGSASRFGIETITPVATLDVNGNLYVASGITGSLFGTSSWAVSASWAPVQVSASYASTASYVSSIASNITSNVNNYILTATGGSTIQGESNLTFDGGTLILNGNLIQGTTANTTSGGGAHAEGNTTVAQGDYSHAEGNLTLASGLASHTEGRLTTASGQYSHAEGDTTQALSDYAHAEGRNTVASAKWSHAEGRETVAAGGYSHAEGYITSASGLYSHAEGLGTVASGSYQHVQGAYNISSSNAAAFIVGNGTSDTSRSNLIFASGSQVQVTGSLIVTAGITGSLFGTASYVTQALSSSFAVTASYISGQFFSTFNQPTAATTWSFAHNLANKNPVITVWSDTDEVIVPEKISGTNSNLATIYFPIPVSGYASATVGSILPTISGSIGNTVITGSLRGEVNALSITSNTASIDLATNNFFTLSLVNGANTHISASNIQPGQTANIRVTQGSLGTGTMTFNSAIKSGSLYTGSAVANAVDIMTFISFDSSTLYMSAVTNLK